MAIFGSGTFLTPYRLSLAIKNPIAGQRELVKVLESNPTSLRFEPAGIHWGPHSAFDNEIDRSLARAFNGYLAQGVYPSWDHNSTYNRRGTGGFPSCK